MNATPHTTTASRPRRLIVGITGASGAIYGIRVLELIRRHQLAESHLIVTKSARRTIATETDLSLDAVCSLADHVYDDHDIGAAVASGSYRTDGMIIAPCSIKTLSSVANSHDDSLVVRAADVVLKERRTLVLLVRETPLHIGHLHLMVRAAEAGAVLAPPVPAFYNHPETLDDVVTHTAGRVLDLFDLDVPELVRWPAERPVPQKAAPPQT
jgi:4-hydroxy-3-polyprenylbenzoate decarboxylase